MAACDQFVAAVRARLTDHHGMLVVGLDGRSGAGKSTLAAAVAGALGSGLPPVAVAVVDGDGFYSGGTAARWDRRSTLEKADQVIDWRRQRAVLEGLRDWGVATWHAFDWDADDWDRDPPPFADRPTTLEATAVVLIDGAYSCRPELQDLLHLRVLVEAPTATRRARLLAREGDEYHDDWDRRWSEAEDHYFGAVMPPERFDLVVAAG